LNILLTNDDGYAAPGLRAALEAVCGLGRAHVVAPIRECSTCSHTITLRRALRVERCELDHFGPVFGVHGSPADCVRLSVGGLLDVPIDLVISGVNGGANAGVDVFYSGTVAAAREAAVLQIPAIAVSQALRPGLQPDWAAVTEITAMLVKDLIREPLPGPGFWSINLPLPLPPNARERIHHVPLEPEPPVLGFRREHRDGQGTIDFYDDASYWTRPALERSDYTIIRDGGIAVTAVPLFGRF
jgi:5'-nucleotidase